MNSSLYYVIGVAYIFLFLVFAARLPRVALALCLGLGPIQRALPGIPAHMTLADLNLCLTFVVFCFQQFAFGKLPRWGPMAPACLFYLVVCFISSVADWRGDTTVVSYLQMIPYLVFAPILYSSYGKSLEDIKPALHLLMAVGFFFSISVIAAMSPSVYGMNKNGLGSSLACITIVEVELWLSGATARRKGVYLFFLVFTLAALLITLSRGAWMGAFAGLVVILTLRRDLKSLLRFCVVLIPLVTIGWFFLPGEDKTFATGFEAQRSNIRIRLEFIDKAWTTFKQEPILGAGVGLRKEMDALNFVLMCLAETGIVGLIAFLTIYIALIRMAARANQTLKMTSWSFSCLAIGTGVMISKLVHALVDHYWSRGCITIAWAGAGLATRAFYDSQMVPRAIAVVRQVPEMVRAKRKRRIPLNRNFPWPQPGTDLPPQT